METINFVIVLVAILAIFYVFVSKENFTSNSGLYNYFYESYMNPYPLPLNNFFSNDKEGEISK
jgi:hypothetical protein